MRRRTLSFVLALAFAAALLHSAPAFAADGIAVQVTNASDPVLCAEKDNVSIAFQSPAVRRFRIEAAHPAYLTALRQDSIAADWTACEFKGDPVFNSGVAKTTRTTVYERPDLWVVGWTFPSFWRPSTTPFRIGGKSFDGLHLIQVWMLRPMGGEEVLVVYPQDGYWRIRPKAPAGRDLTAFGTSVLIGPVEPAAQDAARPVVNLKSLAFDPDTFMFKLEFRSGGRADVTMSEVSSERHVLNVAMSTEVTGKPFAMLRSMYVTEFNNDASSVAIRVPGARGWREAAVLPFEGGQATSLWLGRTTPSRHNTSSPDHVVSGFQGTSSGAD